MIALFSPLHGMGREQLSYRYPSGNLSTHKNAVVMLGISGEDSAAWLRALSTLAQPEEKKARAPMESETDISPRTRGTLYPESNGSVRSSQRARARKIVCCTLRDCLKLCCCICLPKRGD